MIQNNTNSAAIVRWGVYIASALAVSIGAFWLVAWLSGVAARWSAAGVLTVKTNTALGMLLAGLALLLLAPGTAHGPRQWLGTLLSGLVLLIGALSLSEHLVGWNLGIDQLLATEAPGAVSTVSPNRMGPPASTCFTLLGMALLGLGFRKRAIVSYLGIAVCVVNLIPAVGYLYGIQEFYSKPHLTHIAWTTIVALFSLGVGLILAQTERGPMALLLRDDAGGKLLRGMLPWTILLPLVVAYLRTIGEIRGLYDTMTGRGLLVITLILVFSLILWRSAEKLSRSDEAHRADEEALRELEARKQEFYHKTILAATGGKLEIVEPEDIRALHGELVQTWTFSTPEEYSLAVSQSFELAKNLGFVAGSLHRFMSCAGEMLSNAQKHAGGGEASFYRTDSRILFAVSDTGSGIDSINLPDVAFTRGYSTAGTGGLGYKLIIGSADKTYLATGSDGTTVAVEIGMPG